MTRNPNGSDNFVIIISHTSIHTHCISILWIHLCLGFSFFSSCCKVNTKVNTMQPQQATPPHTPPTPSPHPPPSQLFSAISRAIIAEQIALEVTEDSLKPFLVSTHELAISGAPIHKGIYGHTVVAKFKGSQVAAEVLQQPPSSAFNKMILTRELKCSQIRHPNIVQFLGAVTDEGVVIINQLTVTNLHYKLEKKAFPKQEVLNISKDMASAWLSYIRLVNAPLSTEQCLHRTYPWSLWHSNGEQNYQISY